MNINCALCSFTVHLTTIRTWTRLHGSRDCHVNQISERKRFSLPWVVTDEKDLSSSSSFSDNYRARLTMLNTRADDSPRSIIEKAYTSSSAMIIGDCEKRAFPQPLYIQIRWVSLHRRVVDRAAFRLIHRFARWMSRVNEAQACRWCSRMLPRGLEAISQMNSCWRDPKVTFSHDANPMMDDAREALEAKFQMLPRGDVSIKKKLSGQPEFRIALFHQLGFRIIIISSSFLSSQKFLILMNPRSSSLPLQFPFRAAEVTVKNTMKWDAWETPLIFPIDVSLFVLQFFRLLIFSVLHFQ